MRKFFKWLFAFWKPRKTTYRFRRVPDLPVKIKPRTIYIVENDGYAWQINFNCPCGCGELLYVNLLPESKPCWRFEINAKQQLSLSPSIHRNTGCQSHFFVRKGKIDWV